MQTFLTGGQRSQRPISHFPAVTERALEHRIAPQLGEPGQPRGAVVHAGGQQHPQSPHDLAAFQLELEHLVAGRRAHHPTLAQLDAGIARELVPTLHVQLCRRPLVVTQQAADAVRHKVALLTGIDHQRAAPRTAEHQCCAQPGSAAADHDAFPCRLHDPLIAHLRRG
ncbi:MAG: hypothetical protein JWR32_1284 [Mycobacterium sp.]|nr:hypothetical protein [Mycobacterium sp.]MDT5232242.1 hypothetical protein [Mycobacterium sp.]